MICPHCGRNTNTADTCQHCHKPTEFTTRFNSRPGAIPGIEDNPISPPIAHTPAQKTGRVPSAVMFFCVAMSLIACSLSIICLLKIGRLSKKEEIPPVSIPETTSIPVVDCVVTFEWNLQEKNEWIPSISEGEVLPTLQDIEGYLFTGWNTDPNGNGTSFRPGEIFDLELKRDLTLFAQWAPATEQIESTEPETEVTDAAQDVFLSDAFESGIQDGNTFATIPNPLPTQESEDYYG